MGLFPYIGGDARLAPLIVSLLPKASRFVEPFGGAGSISLRVARSRMFNTIIWNDLDPLIFDSFRLVKHYPETIPLIGKVLVKFSRCTDKAVRKKAKALLKELRGKLGSGELSWPWTGFWTIVLHYICHVPYKSGLMLRWVDNPNRFRKVHEHLFDSARLLRRVEIRNQDAFDLLPEVMGRDTVAYVDPPHLTPSSHNTGYYRLDFSPEKARELDELLRSLKGKILVKLSPSDLEHYSIARKWRQIKIAYSKGTKPPHYKTRRGVYFFYANYDVSPW